MRPQKSLKIYFLQPSRAFINILAQKIMLGFFVTFFRWSAGQMFISRHIVCFAKIAITFCMIKFLWKPYTPLKDKVLEIMLKLFTKNFWPCKIFLLGGQVDIWF